MSGRAAIFINYNVAALGVGHVAWAFELSPGQFCFGGKELTGNIAALQGAWNGVFVWTGTEQQMLCAMKTGIHEGAGFTYDDYKYFQVEGINPTAAGQLAQQSFGWGYSLISNNCMDDCYKVIGAYANGNNSVLPPPLANWLPRDFFAAIKSPVQHLRDARCQSAPGAVPLFRLLSSVDNYFYTASGDEANKLIKENGFTYEGAVGYVLSGAVAGTIPLYRLNLPGVEHLYTCSNDERAALLKQGWRDEGIAGYVYPTSDKSSVPLFRLYNNDKHHFYTTSEAERNYAAGRGFHFESVACNVLY